MDVNRRNILEVLGVGGAFGVSTEAVAKALPFSDGQTSLAIMEASISQQERIAAVLEKLAAEIRAKKVTAIGLDVRSSLRPDTYLDHEVVVKVEIMA